MSFLTNLFSGFSKDDEDDEEEEWEEEEEEERSPAAIPSLTEGMTLEVLTKEGHLLLSGRLTGRTAEDLTLERLPGCISFQTLPEGEPVTVRSYNNNMVQMNLTAVIKSSSRTICRLKDIEVQTLSAENQRNSFRITMINTPAWLYAQEDDKYLHPESCTLVDVSTGGCCVESDYIHAEEEILRVKIKLEDYQPLYFLGQIIRVTVLNEGRYRYGILFAQLREDELTALTKTLYNIQVGNRREWIQTDSGHFH